MSSEDIYQNMAERLEEVLPDDWENVILYGEYGTASYSMDCYIDCGDGKFTQCFEMESVSEDKVLEAFSDINAMIRKERDAQDEKDRWSNFTMQINKDGEFKVDYDYTDLSESAYVHEAVWKYRYLGKIPLPNNKMAYEAVWNYIVERL